MKDKAVISLSGGLDSSTLLAYVLNMGSEVVPIIFKYPSKHNQFEMVAAVQVAAYYNLLCHVIDLTPIFSGFQSNLLLSGGPIPDGHYAAETMKDTVVPGRNLIFASVLAGYAESIKANTIALGVHAGDHTIYPDCRPAFISALETVVNASTDGTIGICTPFLHSTKSDIVRWGIKLKVPYAITRTCYKNQEIACGLCGSCQERIEAFQINGIDDPIQYETSKELSK